MVFIICSWRRFTAACAAVLASAPIAAEACSRFVYLGDEDHVITARSMDWKYTPGFELT